VKIAKQKNVVFCLAHAACGGAPGWLARRPGHCFIRIFKWYSVLARINIENIHPLCMAPERAKALHLAPILHLDLHRDPERVILAVFP
jgi:hypothetical protein